LKVQVSQSRSGADDLLDKLSEEREITLQISTAPIPYSDGVLIRTEKLGLSKGAMYKGEVGYTNIEDYKQPSIWLCPATLWVFLKYPKKIYYKIVK